MRNRDLNEGFKIKNRNPVLIVKTIGKIFDKTSVLLDGVLFFYDMCSADTIKQGAYISVK